MGAMAAKERGGEVQKRSRKGRVVALSRVLEGKAGRC